MSRISRYPKEGGFLEYTDKVAAGFTAIIDAEVDGDFDTIYRDYNGFINLQNIQPGSLDETIFKTGTQIPGSALNLKGVIINEDINTEANIDTRGNNKFADFSIPINKLAYGAAVNWFGGFGRADLVGLTVGVPISLLSLPINSRNANCTSLAIGIVSGWVPLPPIPEYDPMSNTIRVALSLDGQSIAASAVQHANNFGETHVGTPSPFPSHAPFSITVLSAFTGLAGNHTVALLAQYDSALTGFGAAHNSSQLIVLSLA